ncbi:unnamed protein product [Pleuronectes platessa]|uniref:Uncharacterized protein n=1 Tax=Pleuronectes platessa TaxID=8262 RepID=A0A9N7YIR9_PLEPL|nr:unnamed protein product [Pleuronectes platessa]
MSQSAHLLSAGIFPLTCLCSTLPVSHTSSSGQLSTPVTALAAFKPAPVSASVPDCSCVMPDFQRVFPGLITCCRPPTCLPRLCPGHYLPLLSSTTSFAYSLLVTLLLGSVATQLTTGPVYQLGNPSAVTLPSVSDTRLAPAQISQMITVSRDFLPCHCLNC